MAVSGVRSPDGASRNIPRSHTRFVRRLNGIWDIFIGSFATLIAAVLTYITARAIKNVHLKLFASAIFPVICNAIAVPAIFVLCGISSHAYIIEALIIGAEEAAVVYTLGVVLYYAVVKIEGRLSARKAAD